MRDFEKISFNQFCKDIKKDENYIKIINYHHVAPNQQQGTTCF